MRTSWVPLSASSLVIGAMCLVLGSVLNPSDAGASASSTLAVVDDKGFRWLAMATMYALASVALTVGIPSVLVLLRDGGRRTGLVGAVVFTAGAVGTCGYAVLTVFLKALVSAHAVRGAAGLDRVSHDRGLQVFVYGWVGAFYTGLLLLGVALFLARTVSRWVPALVVAFVLALPVSSHLGRVGGAVVVMALAVAFTGIAVEAVSRDGRTTRPGRPAYG